MKINTGFKTFIGKAVGYVCVMNVCDYDIYI